MVDKIIQYVHEVKNDIHDIKKSLEYIRCALGRIEGRMSKDGGIEKSEFKVFSQWGEDGIIQYLVNNLKIKNHIFVEFGVEDYTESNTRFLLMNDNWSGLVIDGDETNIKKIKNWELYWRYDLKAVCKFITKDNINDIITNNGISGEIGILSIDIDGNDYWIWENITVVNPCIVICEYNSLFGNKRKLTTPYRDDFIRDKYHFSNIVYGASMAALNELGEKKGYSLVAVNQAGNNLFFVRNDLIGDLEKKRIKDLYHLAKFREERDETGRLLFRSIGDKEQIEGIRNVHVFDLEIKKEIGLLDVLEEK